MKPSSLFIACAILYCLSLSPVASHTCINDRIDLKPKVLKMTADSELEGRALADSYESIRIHFDFSNLGLVDAATRTYISETLILPTKNYFESALKVKRFTSRLALGDPLACDDLIIVPPEIMTVGVEADLLIFVTQAYEPFEDFVAWAGPCYFSVATGRPAVGIINFNTGQISATTDNATIDANIMASLHELTHVLGFIGSIFSRFVDPATNQLLTGHIIPDQMINGLSTDILNVEPLTTRLRNHFNCPNLEGAYMENQGGSGSLGSHFERKVFHNEFMASSVIVDERISEFTLALLEGSGWYQVDYTKAEPLTWGKNKGCNFLRGACYDTGTQTANFEEFCSNLAQPGCSWTGRGTAFCGGPRIAVDNTIPASIDYWGNSTVVTDMFADNCPYMNAGPSTDCESAVPRTTNLPGREYHGEGSRCFTGTLGFSAPTLQPVAFCFKQECAQDLNGNYFVKVTVGSSEVTCTAPGLVSVTDNAGTLNCPDPDAFCRKAVAEGTCRRACFGKGTCGDSGCVCFDGWGGDNCRQKAFSSVCAQCSHLPSSACYGDECLYVAEKSDNKELIGGLVGGILGGIFVLTSGILTALFIKGKLSCKKKQQKTQPNGMEAQKNLGQTPVQDSAVPNTAVNYTSQPLQSPDQILVNPSQQA